MVGSEKEGRWVSVGDLVEGSEGDGGVGINLVGATTICCKWSL